MSYKRISPQPVVEGGTGASTLTAHGVLLGEGTSAITPTAVGTNGQLLIGSSAADPGWVTPTAGTGLSGTFNATTHSYALSTPVSVANGGTGESSLTAYAVLCGGTTSTGAVQSIASVGTSGQVLTSNGAGALPTFQAASGGSAFTTVNVQVFTSTGTYTPTANMAYCIVEAVGGGGGGGGVPNNTSSQACAAGGGGGGGYARIHLSAATVGSSQTVTINTGGSGGAAGSNPGSSGGSVTFGSLLTANGGAGGAAGVASSTGLTIKAGGLGGTASSGDFNATGGPGGYGSGSAGGPSWGGQGGNSYLGGGGLSPIGLGNDVFSAGNNATGYGGGGSGAFSVSVGGGTGAEAGGNGTNGIVIVTEYIT
jgi:hypothetical protein